MEYIKLGDILLYEQPTKYIVESDRYDDSYQTPVLTAGKSFILGYTDEKEGIFEDFPVIIFDDFTTAIKYVDFPFKVKSSAMKILRPNKDKADIKYLYYKMLTIETDSEQHKRYWISKYSQIEIPLPDLATQQRIAALLDKADELRQYNKQLIEKYDTLTQSLFLDMFGDPVRNEKGWEKVDFSLLCDFQRITIQPEKIREGENYIPLESIEKQTGQILNVELVSKGDLKSSKFYFTEEYILHGKLRPYLNKVATPNFSGVCSTDIIPIKPRTNKTNRPYIVQIMRGSGFVSYCVERTSGANLPRISPREVEKFQVINPPIALQNQFAERVKLIEQQKEMAQQALQKSEELFNCLLQKAFKGELIPEHEV